MQIKSVDAYQVFDSRGFPTVEAVVELESGLRGRGVTPAGKSTGQFEALVLVDGDPRRFHGKSVFQAIAHVRQQIGPALVGHDVRDQEGIDLRMRELDGTPNKSRLGANAILAVSLAVAQAAAGALQVPLYRRLGSGTLLPLPQIQIFGGGAHAAGRVDIQDFQITTVGATTYEQCLEMAHNVYCAARDLLARAGKLRGTADEGGFWPEFDGNQEALETLLAAIEAAGYVPGTDVAISLDIAASGLYESPTYRFASEHRSFTSDELLERWVQWCAQYPIVSIEDPFADTDWEAWRQFTSAVGHKVQVLGDDLFCTSLSRLDQGIELGLANAALIKLNQVGTVTETLAAIEKTRAAGWLPVVSARSGETEDAFVAHLAVATDAGQLKVGSFAHGERMAKWNEVLRIGHALGAAARFQGGRIYQSIRRAVPPAARP